MAVAVSLEHQGGVSTDYKLYYKRDKFRHFKRYRSIGYRGMRRTNPIPLCHILIMDLLNIKVYN